MKQCQIDQSKGKYEKSSNRRTKCKCPTCGKTYPRKLHLQPCAREKVDPGIPYPRRCDSCTVSIGQYDYCDIIDGHSIRMG